MRWTACGSTAKLKVLELQCGLRGIEAKDHTVEMEVPETADLNRSTVNPGQRSGQPCIRGIRITPWDVLSMRGSGMSEEEILEDYPYLEKADFLAVYAYAARMGRGKIS